MKLWSLRRPDDAELARFLDGQRSRPASYTQVGATRGQLPDGWAHEHHRRHLGTGPACFATARDAMRAWQMFPAGLARVSPATPPMDGESCVVLLHLARVWWLNAVRVVYLDDEPRRYAYALGTLPGHVAIGEEAFVLHHDADDSVWFEVRAFTRQRLLAARLASPVSRALRALFVRESLAAMSRAAMHPGMVRS